ncbi:Uncharacterised protein [Mycobacteroides abscessus subsp. abscessus]|nr:Uncharacterised protein [Mycobacteroides abscessus subsp. abscessus]
MTATLSGVRAAVRCNMSLIVLPRAVATAACVDSVKDDSLPADSLPVDFFTVDS